jgi:hypothetical protein
MFDIIRDTLRYFQSARKSLWRWSADGEVVEFHTGDTIAYREELVLLLQYFTEQGLPPLPPLLLILYACLEAPNGIEKTEIGKILKGWTVAAGPPIVKLMQVIQGLPAECRTGARKGLLLQEIFRDASPFIPTEYARAVLDEFRSGRLNARVLEQPLSARYEDINLRMLHDASKRFPTTESLLLRLRTGLDILPEEAPGIIPELPPEDLLQQLLSDPKTEGVARLTQRLVAALHITMHTEAAGDLPLGGYADISTRGDLDRLLLSELAYDDDMLTARLVNNEALYLRREEPPDSVLRQRVIVLDTTLLLWGLPRVFAVSAALAATRNLPPHTTAHVVALGGETHTPLALSTRDGIIHALEQLDGALHCGAALENVIRRGGFDDNADYLLITDEEALQDPDFDTIYRTVREQLQFLITVSRHGTLQFYALRNGRRKLLNSATYDLGDLLLTPRKVQGPNIMAANTPVAFIQKKPAPLYFPPVGLACTPDTAYQTYGGVFCVTHAKRLLYWHSRQHGATELLHHIGGHKYFFYTGEEGFLSLLSLDTINEQLHYYKIDLQDTTAIHIDLTAHFQGGSIFICSSYLLFFGKHGLTGINCHQGRLVSDDELKEIAGIGPEIETFGDHHVIIQRLSRYRYKNEYFAHKQMRRVTKVGAHVLQHVTSVTVTSWGNLLINNYALLPIANDTLKLLPPADKRVGGSHFRAESGHPCSMIDNPQVQFFPFHWTFGGHAYGDTRGLLHLESGKAEIPSVTLVLTLDAPVACWSSDGHACGLSYFIRDENLTRLPAEEFYEKYIKRFIDDITQHHRPSL